jgi:hypothetical protein
MKLKLGWASLVPLIALFVVALASFMAGHFPTRPRRALVNGTNNPNSFGLWQTDSGITYNFRYDPHAADAWRFKAGPELSALVQSVPAESTTANPTR